MDRREYLKTLAAGSLSSSFLLESCENNSKTLTENAVSSSTLSQRGVKASQTVLRVDFDLYFQAAANLYHEVDNPSGAFPLNVAENKLNWSLLKDKLEQLTSQNPISSWVANYTDSVGSPTSREVMAKFLTKHLTKCPIDPAQIGLSPGATSVICLSSWILGEAGDVAVFPAPCYSVYKQDIGNKAAMERYDLITHHELTDLKNGPLLTTEHLDKALSDIQSQGKRMRMLVITNPENPTGGIYTKEQLESFTDWCIERKIHLIVNEIYGLSQIDTTHPNIKDDYQDNVEFFSFANIMNERKSDYLHRWYALSKDFGASGFRVGVVHSMNKDFLAAYNNLNGPSMVSNYTQWIFELALADDEFVENYITTNKKLLTANYATAVTALKKLNIPYVPARGSLFVWLDLSEFLDENTQEAESKFWMELYEKTGVLLTPGDGFGHTKHGQFRLVYSYVPQNHLEVAMSRLGDFVGKKRSHL